MQLRIRYIIILFVLHIVTDSKAQFVVDSISVDSIKEIKEIAPIQADFLFSYYEQDGTKSPVTGGIGDEELRDRVGNITLVVPVSNKVTFNFHGGIDAYSSASTDNINNEYGLYTETSASYSDQRVYGNVGVQLNNDKRRLNYGLGVGISKEYDVDSYNASIHLSKLSANRNTMFYFKGIVFYDKWMLIYPSELRSKYITQKLTDDDYGSDIRSSYSGIFTIEQDIASRIKGSITFEPTYQTGLLSTPFHRVYFQDSFFHDIEKLPSNRIKFPTGIHLNYYINKYFVTRWFYRYYFDDFGVKAHTASIELPIKPFSWISFSPFYRIHLQTQSDYFKPFGFHSILDEYYTSDFDMANVTSHRYGLELKWAPNFISGKQTKTLNLKKISIRASKYDRFREDELILKSYIVALYLSFRVE